MAYRFLLEVPETLAQEANVAVASTGDAQVLVDRNSHGLGFDDPYHNLTVAAQTLRVIPQLYGWASEIGATRPDSRFKVGIVLHGGQRLGMHEIDQADMIAAIRRDQPWVEHTLPKIGEHEPVYTGEEVATKATSSLVATPTTHSTGQITGVDLIEAEDELIVNGRTYAVVQVGDLAPAERFYSELFNLDIEQRMWQDEVGVWQVMPDDYDHDTAAQEDDEADVVFMTNEPLNLAVVRAGRAARLEYATINNDIAVAMTPEATHRVKALALMRGYNLLESAGPTFAFRDPFGVVWDIHPTA